MIQASGDLDLRSTIAFSLNHGLVPAAGGIFPRIPQLGPVNDKFYLTNVAENLS